MSSVTQDPWLTENSPVDDLGVVELFFKSLDSSGTGVNDHCWTTITGTDTTTDTNFPTPTPSEKIGYEPFSLPSLANCLKDTLEIKQEPCDESCPLVDQSPETLDIGIQCTASLPSLQEFSSFRYSSQLPSFGQPGSASLGASPESWLQSPNSYLSNFDSLKVIPELLVERICQDEASPGTNSNLPQSNQPLHQFKLEVSQSYLRGQCKVESTAVQHCQQLQQSSSFLPSVLSSKLSAADTQQAFFNNVVVKQEPTDDTMNLSGHFMCHPMFMVNNPGPKCGCDMSKGQHFLCGNSKAGMSMEQYGELLKRGSNVMLGDSPAKSFTATPQSIRSDKERPFSCEECGKSFLLKHHLVTHSRVHSGLRPFGCGDCGKTFAHKHCLVTHQRLHSGLRPFQCVECKKSFTLKHHLVTHSRTHSKDRPFHCEECGRTFSQKRNLVTHAKLHSGERPFQCSICGECFSQREHLLAHSRFHGGESAFVCVDCGEAFARKFQLVDHRRQHGHSPYSCTICGKEFLQKRTLVAHTKLHEGTRPFLCKHCSQSFPRMSDLVSHSRIHTNFSCKECGSNFPTHEGLVLHLQHHGQGVAPGSSGPPSKPFPCPECGSGFAQKHGLVQHMNRKHSANSASSEAGRLSEDKSNAITLTHSCDIMEQIKHQVLSEQVKAKIQ